MWRKIFRVLGFLMGWSVVFAYIWYASRLTQAYQAKQRVSDVVITISEGGDTRQFSTSERIGMQMKRGGFDMSNKLVDSVDAVKIAEYIARNGYVKDVDVYITYSGTLHIDVTQHEPVMRLMCGGLNSYITKEGDIFRSPQGASYYLPVVTGSYKPLFASTYEGTAEEHLASLMKVEDDKLAKLGAEFAELRHERSECMNRKNDLRKSKRKKFLESKTSWEQRCVAIALDMEKCNKELKQLALKRTKLEARRSRIDVRKKKLQKSYDDFANLTTFVSSICEDSFWGAEVVQFVADTTSLGAISLRLVPRSGDFIIEFGTIDNGAEKLAKLEHFYEAGLSHIGWDKYRVVDVRYNKQVICTE